jgi:Mrp family chromosome partitioning ATPase
MRPVSQCVFFDERAGIHLLPAGTVPPNPLELLSSKRFEDVVTKLKEAFDIVLIDSAPLQLVSDAQVLSQFAVLGDLRGEGRMPRLTRSRRTA